MSNPKNFPSGSQSIGSGDVVTTPTTSWLLEIYNSTSTNIRKAVSIANLLATLKGVIGVAAGYKVARVEMALDGSNPTAWATGLTSVVAVCLTLKGTAAPGVGTTVLTYDISVATVNVYAWKPTATDNCTLIASTGTETFSGIAIGT